MALALSWWGVGCLIWKSVHGFQIKARVKATILCLLQNCDSGSFTCVKFFDLLEGSEVDRSPGFTTEHFPTNVMIPLRDLFLDLSFLCLVKAENAILVNSTPGCLHPLHHLLSKTLRFQEEPTVVFCGLVDAELLVAQDLVDGVTVVCRHLLVLHHFPLIGEDAGREGQKDSRLEIPQDNNWLLITKTDFWICLWSVG